MLGSQGTEKWCPGNTRTRRFVCLMQNGSKSCGIPTTNCRCCMLQLTMLDADGNQSFRTAMLDTDGENTFRTVSTTVQCQATVTRRATVRCQSSLCEFFPSDKHGCLQCAFSTSQRRLTVLRPRLSAKKQGAFFRRCRLQRSVHLMKVCQLFSRQEVSAMPLIMTFHQFLKRC